MTQASFFFAFACTAAASQAMVASSLGLPETAKSAAIRANVLEAAANVATANTGANVWEERFVGGVKLTSYVPPTDTKGMLIDVLQHSPISRYLQYDNTSNTYSATCSAQSH